MATKPKGSKHRTEPEAGTRGQPFSWFDKAVAAKIVELRDTKELGWGDIADQTKMTAGKAILLYKVAKLKKSELITGTDAEIAKTIARLRDKEKLSEGDLMARTGFAPSKLHSFYEAATGRSWNDSHIGKGGRVKGAAPKAKKESAPKAKAKSKSNGATTGKTKSKKTGKVTGAALAKMGEEEIITALTGKTIVVARGEGKVQKLRATGAITVSKNGSGLTVSFTDDEAKSRAIRVDSIKAVR